MQGMIFIEFIEMMDEKLSPTVSERVITLAGVDSGGSYTSSGNYDASEFIAIIAQLSAVVGEDMQAFLVAFGRRLFQRFCDKYPDQIARSGGPLALLPIFSSVYQGSVSRIHPDAEAPRTEFVRINDRVLQIDYTADSGMSHVTEGVIRGVLDFFKTEADLNRQLMREGGNEWVRFTVTCRQSMAA